MNPPNEMTPAQIERLALIAEEMGECQQAIGKLLRHGRVGTFDGTVYYNVEDLERECGHVVYAIRLACFNGDLDKLRCNEEANAKGESIHRTLHHGHLFPPPARLALSN